jgi:hypothetical protein
VLCYLAALVLSSWVVSDFASPAGKWSCEVSSAIRLTPIAPRFVSACSGWWKRVPPYSICCGGRLTRTATPSPPAFGCSAASWRSSGRWHLRRPQPGRRHLRNATRAGGRGRSQGGEVSHTVFCVRSLSGCLPQNGEGPSRAGGLSPSFYWWSQPGSNR